MSFIFLGASVDRMLVHVRMYENPAMSQVASSVSSIKFLFEDVMYSILKPRVIEPVI